MLGYFRARPILLLLLLSPGIPEYISGSSGFNVLVLNPARFFLQIALNLGLYGPGVLLIREAMVRWQKGWASVLILGAAYGILEEGVALSTLYNPLASPVGRMGYYGHYLGVSWIWVSSIIPVHMIFSISLPILLLGLALPETVGKSLIVSRRRIGLLFVILGADVVTLFLLVLRSEHFWMGWPVFLGSVIAIFALVFVARKVPANFLRAKTELPRTRPLITGIVGVSFYIIVILIESGIGSRIPAAADLVLVLLVEAAFFVLILQVIGRVSNSRQLIALASGLVIPIAFIGVISEVRFPLILFVDLAYGLLMWKLWKIYGIEETSTDLGNAAGVT